MTLAAYVLLGVIDIAVIVSLSVFVGATAPRWPARWLANDTWLTRPRSWETPTFFHRLGVARWAVRLPEWGSLFGGRSKREGPGRDLASVEAYLVEVRRAIYVHSLSLLSWVPLVFFNPWWLSVAGAVIAVGINVPFLLILRGNNARLSRIVSALRQREGGSS